MIRNFKNFVTKEDSNKEKYIEDRFQNEVDKILNSDNFDKIINDIKYVKSKINILDKLDSLLNNINKKYIQMSDIEDAKEMYSQLTNMINELEYNATKIKELVYKIDDIKNNTLNIKTDIMEMRDFLRSI